MNKLPCYLLVIVVLNCLSMRRALKVTRENFWQDLGAPKFIAAPMVDQSNLAWRLLVRQNGVDVAFTQMVHTKNFVKDKSFRKEIVDWTDYTTSTNSPALEEEARRLDRPLFVQLAGDNPDYLIQTGLLIQEDATAIDLNLGCPQKIAKKGHYGAYLLPEKDLVVKLLSGLVRELTIPVTAKIRKLPREEDTLALVRAIEDCGVSMITVHGRLATQNKQFTGQVDWDIIRKIKQTVRIPVVANGGISCRDDALRCLEYTGADAVMSSEGLLQNPKLFSVAGDEAFKNDFCRSQLTSAMEYVALTQLYPLPRPLETVVRGHLFKMLHRFFSAPVHFPLRETMASGSFKDMIEVVNTLNAKFAAIDYNTQYAEREGWVSKTDWYMRHRDERSETRVLSLPRVDPATGVRTTFLASNNGRESKSVADLQSLKERLKTKHGSKIGVPSVTSTAK